ncbi:MAG: enolase C-terminal domain-like protein [Pirellulales bacterium]
MGRFPIAARVVDASVAFRDWPLAAPLLLSTGAITSATAAEATVVVRVDGCEAAGREAEGRGAVFLSELWAWPAADLPRAFRAARLQQLAQRTAERLVELTGAEPQHPLELGLRLLDQAAAGACDDEAPPAPRLARLLAASPFDAALHDAVGKALDVSAYRLYDPPQPVPSADAWFGVDGAAAAVGAMLRVEPQRVFPATFVVGPADGGEALAELVRRWAVERGYGRVKLKLRGVDPIEDARRCCDVTAALRAAGVAQPWISVDMNGACPDMAAVATFLDELARGDADAFAALQYLEQPTAAGRTDVDWRGLRLAKPVLLDEGLEGLDSFVEAMERGWSGGALKTCKGLSLMLVVAAWAMRHGRTLALQDLTNPGRAAVQAAWFAAHLPTVNGLELNSPQFVPAANEPWRSRRPELLDVHDGCHRLTGPVPAGLAEE